MSSISNISSGSNAWALERPDPARMKQRMFDKTDADGSGTVDTDELKSLLAQAAERTGQDLGDADAAMKTMDSNGDGSLDADELDQGLRDLMPPPGSTVEFAQRRDADDLKSLSSALQQLAQVVDSDQDQTLSDGETERFGSVLQQALKEQDQKTDGSGNDAQRLTALIQRLVALYQDGDAGSNGSTSSSSGGTASVDLSA